MKTLLPGTVRTWFFTTLITSGFIMTVAQPVSAVLVSINTSALNGASARLDFQILDGDLAANNNTTISSINTNGLLQGIDCSVGCSGGPPFVITDTLGLGQFIQDLVLGTVLSIDTAFTNQFAGGDADLFVINLLDPATNFSLVDTNLDQLAGAVPFQDALFVYNFATGQLITASVSTPLLSIATVNEPANWLLMMTGGALLLCVRTLRWVNLKKNSSSIIEEEKTMLTNLCRALASLLSLTLIFMPPVAFAANHREAPITALDHKADITDWFAFVSYNDPTKVTMILNVDPLLEPANGPNYFPFDPEILYEMKIDNNQDGKDDIKLQFRFNTEIRLPGVFTSFVGVGNGVPAPSNSPPPVTPGTPILPPAITALDGAGSEGLSLRQNYTVTLLKKSGNGNAWQPTDLTGNRKLFAVPSNVGPRTMPNYENLARQGIYTLSNGIRVFAGTVDDPFYIDLGAAFDTLNFRPSAFGTGVPGVLTDAQDGDDTRNFAPDSVAGFNVNTIAVEIPIALLTSDGALHPASDPKALIGTYATTSRPRTKVLPTQPGGKSALSANFVQIQRMGNPLINELIIGTGDKDKFSMSEPEDDGQFANYFLDPLLARVFNAAYGGAVPIPTPPRIDLLPLVNYTTLLCPGCNGLKAGPVADFLRLNTGIAPTSQANRKRLGALAGDFGGFPNGRRVSDDVLDISARAVAGVLAGAPFNGFPNNRIGDAVNTNDRPYQETFPYVAFANSGRNSRHQNPGTAGCADALSFTPKDCPTD